MPDLEPLTIDSQPIGNGWVLALRGELDLATAPMLNEHLRELQRAALDRLVLDLRELSFMDCAGLGVIVAADLRARQAETQLEVLCGPGQIKKVFTLTGVDRQVTISAPATQAPGGSHSVTA